MPAAPPETDADRTAWRALLAVAIDAAGGQGALSELLRCDRSAVSRWLDGSRTLGWANLRAALRRTATHHPAEVPQMVAALAALLLDARGRWVPESEAGGAGSWSDELADEAAADCALHAAVSACDPVALSEAVQRAHRELDQQADAGTREIQRRLATQGAR